jgi:putative ABC transport system substrate-binding protein
MKRRDVISLLGAAAAMAPLPVRAQPAGSIPAAGFLFSETASSSGLRIAAFLQGLKEAGYVEGQTVAVEYRWADGHRDRLGALAADLVRRKVAAICAGNVNSALAAKAATASIPIVFLTAGDPVADGLVASFNKPGGNATGVRIFSAGLVAKRLQLLHELVPAAKVIGFLSNPTNPTTAGQIANVQAAAGTIGMQTRLVSAGSEAEFEIAFKSLGEQKVDAVAIGADPFFNSASERLVGLAARYRLPAVYEWREAALGGGLMSYGTSVADAFRSLGVYTGRILHGERPADLPVLQPTTFELVINVATARVLGLAVPPLLLTAADEVIE